MSPQAHRSQMSQHSPSTPHIAKELGDEAWLGCGAEIFRVLGKAWCSLRRRDEDVTHAAPCGMGAELEVELRFDSVWS